MKLREIREIFKKYMIPFFEEHGYTLTTSDSEGYYFEHTENPKLRIVYHFQREYTGTFELNVIIVRDDKGGLPYIGLTCFVDDPEFPDSTIFNGDWYFDTEEELIGSLEEQANLFLEKAFRWLTRTEDDDIGKISIERAAERARIYYTGTPEEKERKFNELQENLTKWELRRVKPKLWMRD